MKKIIFILIAVLAGFFVLLSVLTPPGEYSAEKSFWKITKDFSRKAAAGQTLSPGDAQFLTDRIKGFITRYPKSQLIPHAKILVVDVHTAAGDYTTARQDYAKVIQSYPDRPEIVEIAMVKIMNSFYQEKGKSNAVLTEDQKEFNRRVEAVFNKDESAEMIKIFEEVNKGADFDLMLRISQRAMKEFPATSIGLQAPLFIATLYTDAGKIEESRAAFEAAVKYYKDFIVQHVNTPVEIEARKKLVSTYLAQGKPKEATAEVGEILNHPSAAFFLTRANYMELTGLLTQLTSQTKDVERAKQIYQRFIENHSDFNLVELAKKELAELNQGPKE